MVKIDVVGEQDRLWAVKRQPDGKIVAAGFATDTGLYDWVLLRLNEDGTNDPTFNGTGMKTVDFGGGQEDVVRGLAIQPDGDIVVVGLTRFDVGGSDQEDIAISRFNGDNRTEPLFYDGFESGDTSI